MVENNTEYHLVEQLIEQLTEAHHHRDIDSNTDLDLTNLSNTFGLSPNQIQRIFSKWAGISPKRFGQYLTIQSLQSRLSNNPSNLDLSVDAGLSSVSLVHAHFVNFYSMTPLEFRNGGQHLRISSGFYLCPFGLAHIASTDKGICWLAFIDSAQQETSSLELRAQWPQATYQDDEGKHHQIIKSLFSKDKNQPLYLHIKGTNFQLKVWEALLNVPLGQCASYNSIAHAIGQPSASRAVGSAIGKNPVAWLIPCHRVIRATGVIGQYRWGHNRKKSLLGWEAANAQQRPEQQPVSSI